MDKPTPRINSSMIQQYTNTTVRVVGKVLQTQGSGFVLETSTGGQVVVIPTVECTYSSQFVEIVGRVQNDGTISGYSAVNLSDNFGMYCVYFYNVMS
ncbi:replication factor A protein 3 [Coemansia spiralis]|nr:replication factor A protein 3 [Coemansia spiralis]